MPAILSSLALCACARPATADPAVLAPLPAASPTPIRPDHVTLPADDAPHSDLTEWWYYTGHLAAPTGGTYGFELVIFQGNREGQPPAYAAHFAVTDNQRGDFHFAQQQQVGAQVHAGPGFNLNLKGWTMRGEDGHDHLTASTDGYAIDLDLVSQKPAVLHEGKGLISFGPAGDSYYYSRTRLGASGVLTDHGQPVNVTGLAWMDHQWGNFISAGGGWDWFSMQLDDRSEVMLFLLRDAAGKPAGSYGTRVDPAGQAQVLSPSSLAAQALGRWTSPESGITYPSAWTVDVPGLKLRLTPTVKDQELRTTASTGVTYWEGDVNISGTKAGRPIAGQGYVELVGYGK